MWTDYTVNRYDLISAVRANPTTLREREIPLPLPFASGKPAMAGGGRWYGGSVLVDTAF